MQELKSKFIVKTMRNLKLGLRWWFITNWRINYYEIRNELENKFFIDWISLYN